MRAGIQVRALPDPDYVVEDWFQRGGVAVLYAAPDAGKSLVANSIAWAACRGEPWFGFETHAGPVLYLTGEGAQQFQKRLQAFPTDDPSPCYSETAFNLTQRKNLERLATDVVRHGAHLVVMDPLGEYGAQEYGEVETTEAFAHAARALARGLDICVLIVMHTNAAGERERGTAHMRQLATTMIRVEKIGDHEIGLVTDKQRNGQSRAARLAKVGVEETVTLEIVHGRPEHNYFRQEYEIQQKSDRERVTAARGRTVSAEKLDEARNVVVSKIPARQEHARSQKTILSLCHGSGYGTETVKAALAQLIEEGVVETGPGRTRQEILHWRANETEPGSVEAHD